jgi:uncharacterized membrane protein
MKRTVLLSALIAAFLALGLAPSLVFADSPIASNSVIIATAFPALVVEQGSSVTFSLDLENNTSSWQQLTLAVNGPSDWNPTFTSAGNTVREAMIAPGKSQSVDLQLKPPANAKPQDYQFQVKATTQDGTLVSALPLIVTLQNKVSQSAITLTTQYPDLQGPASNSFKFTLSVTNDSTQERTVNFNTTVPTNWQTTLQPSYQSTEVSSISMKANDNQSIDVTVTPPHDAAAGEYPIVVHASAGSDQAELPLKVVIVGNPAVSLSTASGQLNTQASVDSAAKMTLTVKNTGSAPLQNLSITASTPDGWNVSFSPDKIDTLAVGQTANVNATIQPGTQALAGDYMVTVTASAGSASDSKDIRVTVETPTAWGWAAVGAIAVVVIGLGVVFARYSRR